MEKATIFFSHSSKDKEMITYVKNRIDTITGKSLNIFVSSDGQSIPFGKNWVHRIEEGLTSAEIMFVFVTPNSIESGWIYFEAGFAYSKDIEVIPVGIGIDIGSMKAPLNLLQGFNITSGDSLNNFITILNKKFGVSFDRGFSDEDYSYLISIASTEPLFDMNKIFKYADYELASKTKYSDVDAKYQAVKTERQALSKQIRGLERRINKIDKQKENIRKNMI